MFRTFSRRPVLRAGVAAVLAVAALAACDPPAGAPRDRVPQIISTVPADVEPDTFTGAARPSPTIEEVAVGLDGRTVRLVWTGAPLACAGPSRMRFQVVERAEAEGGDWLLASLEVRAAVPATLCDGEPVRYSTADRIPDELVVTDGMEVVGAQEEPA